MSTKYKISAEVPTAALAKRLDELSDVVGQSGEERDRELTQRIPAELDRDADLVLCEAAQRLVKLETERDALAAHAERQSELLRRLVSAMRNYEMDADPDYPPPRDHRAMMSDAEAALGAAPETSLDRRDFMTKADAFSEAAAICRKVQEGQDSLAWMHKAVTPDGEEYVDESGIPYSNKAMGAEHCVDDLLREEKKLRKQAEAHQ